MLIKVIFAAALSTALALPALAATFVVAPAGTEGRIVTVDKTGRVIATFLGNEAGFSNDLYLVQPGGDRFLFNSHTTARGTTIDLGTFTAGTELVFRLHSSGFGGKDYYTGPASRNPDVFAHARVDHSASLRQTVISWEDWWGPDKGNDRDYNDLSFSFSNTEDAIAVVPLPAALPLMGSALCGLAILRRHRRRM